MNKTEVLALINTQMTSDESAEVEVDVERGLDYSNYGRETRQCLVPAFTEFVEIKIKFERKLSEG